ncbi:MAG: tetratricopeptide repeat protein [Planctomycetaceae bacterium]|nr:tetratricopeptide repeat protein [Planctomycetaceae bacterium]
MPTFFLFALNVVLFLADFGHPTNFFLRKHVNDEEVVIENIDFGRTFFPRDTERAPLPVSFDATKSKDEVRIFVLGESAAMGFPNEAFSFARILEVMLSERYPKAHFTVVNTSMTAINSHVILPIARSCADFSPDFFVIYMGNNEIVGPYGVSGVLGAHARQLELARMSIWFKTTRIGQLLACITQFTSASNDTPTSWQGMSMFANSRLLADDPRLASTYDQFEANLREICSVGKKSGASVVISTVATNLQDCAPFSSLPSSGLSVGETSELELLLNKGAELEANNRLADAIACYESAIEIDGQYADSHFRLARCLVSVGRIAEAKHHYLCARDCDVLRFRADSTINERIRTAVAGREKEGLYLVDAEAAFENASQDGLLGHLLFFEHVHMTFKGNYTLAKSILEQIDELLPTWVQSQLEPAEPISEAECMNRLAYTDWSRLTSLVTINRLFAHPPFTEQIYRDERDLRMSQEIQTLEARLELQGFDAVIAAYEQSLERVRDNVPILKEFGILLLSRGDFDGAAAKFALLKKHLPHHPGPCVLLAEAYAAQGRRYEALKECDAALKLSPRWKQAIQIRAELQAALSRPQ